MYTRVGDVFGVLETFKEGCVATCELEALVRSMVPKVLAGATKSVVFEVRLFSYKVEDGLNCFPCTKVESIGKFLVCVTVEVVCISSTLFVEEFTGITELGDIWYNVVVLRTKFEVYCLVKLMEIDKEYLIGFEYVTNEFLMWLKDDVFAWSLTIEGTLVTDGVEVEEEFGNVIVD